MNIKAYLLNNHAPALQPASNERAWLKENEAVYANPPCRNANGKGLALLCPYALEATWNGGPDAEDIELHLETADADQPVFVRSQLGGGILTFHAGYQIKTEDAHDLWVRGPVNAPKDGLYPLESMADTSMLPCTITIHWKFKTVRFEAGEPFCTLLAFPKHDLENLAVEVIQTEEDLESYEEEFQETVHNPAFQSVFQRLGATEADTTAREQAFLSSDDETARSTWAAQLTDPPPVSCICHTYGRAELLEEAVYSFLRQDYPGHKELIVLNDYDRHTLQFEHPEVRMINVSRRFNSAGEKYKAAAALASHDLIFVWHDDDIYLPHRLSFTVAHIEQGKGFFKADKAWFWNEGQLSGPQQNVFHGGSCWTRDLFVKLHGYPHIGNTYDIEFEQLCKDEAPGSVYVHTISPANIYYIYRWARTGSYHFSAMGQNGDAYDEVAAYVEKEAQQGRIRQGQIQLHPHWNIDYVKLVQDYLTTNPGLQAVQEEEIPFPPPFVVIPSPEPMADAAVKLFKGDYPIRISVILPTCNESVMLKRTVEQFVATVPANGEIIVVDNGSTDGCADFLVERAQQGVHLLRTPEPLGVAGARNRGLALAQGEIVVFADAHIDVPEHWWQPMVALLNCPDVGVVGPGMGVMGKPNHPVAYGQRIAEPKLRLEWLPWRQKEPYPVPTLGGGFMAMRHDTLKQAGAFDAGMPQWGSEDLELCVRYWLLGYEVWVAPQVTVLHYFRKANPYKVTWGAITHNLLRVALLHFGQARIGRVISALKSDAKFGDALAHAVESDVWQKRAEFAARKVRDDEWLFEKFQDSCHV